jgi:hypothetical protein
LPFEAKIPCLRLTAGKKKEKEEKERKKKKKKGSSIFSGKCRGTTTGYQLLILRPSLTAFCTLIL